MHMHAVYIYVCTICCGSMWLGINFLWLENECEDIECMCSKHDTIQIEEHAE